MFQAGAEKITWVNKGFGFFLHSGEKVNIIFGLLFLFVCFGFFSFFKYIEISMYNAI